MVSKYTLYEIKFVILHEYHIIKKNVELCSTIKLYDII